MKWLFAVLLLASCGGNTPQPIETQTFSVIGTSVSVQGRLKPGAKISVKDAKQTAQARVEFLDRITK